MKISLEICGNERSNYLILSNTYWCLFPNGSVWSEVAKSAAGRVVLLQLLSIHDGAVDTRDLGVMLLWSKTMNRLDNSPYPWIFLMFSQPLHIVCQQVLWISSDKLCQHCQCSTNLSTWHFVNLGDMVWLFCSHILNHLWHFLNTVKSLI